MEYVLLERAIYSFSFGRIQVKFDLIQGHHFHGEPQKMMISLSSNSCPGHQRNNKPTKESIFVIYL
jgi:hypothetical protein